MKFRGTSRMNRASSKLRYVYPACAHLRRSAVCSSRMRLLCTDADAIPPYHHTIKPPQGSSPFSAISIGPCPPPPTPAPSIATWTQPPTTTPVISSFTSSFETDFDGWSDSSFLRKSGTTPSYGTGPSAAADGTYYVYAETSGNSDTNFVLEKTLPAGEVLSGVAFQYHMYGSAMGSVVLESSADGSSWATLWSKSGDLGDQWNQALVFAGNHQKMLRFTYTSASSGAYYYGDFALDDIRSIAETPTATPTLGAPPTPAPTGPRTCYTVRGRDAEYSCLPPTSCLFFGWIECTITHADSHPPRPHNS